MFVELIEFVLSIVIVVKNRIFFIFDDFECVLKENKIFF